MRIDIGLPGLIFVVFLVLKLIGVIDWSWWWVTSPLWLPIVVIAAGYLLIVVASKLFVLLFGSFIRERNLKKYREIGKK